MLARLKLSPFKPSAKHFEQIRRLLLLGCLLLSGDLLAINSALAHARLVQSTPADGSHAPSPSTIALTFSEPVKPIFLRLKRGGRIVDSALAALSVEGINLEVVLIRALEQGDYIIEYRVVTADTHPVSGTVSFRVE
ncbi:MAG: copper resistance protein CopC [Rhodospirillaceae bacterium]|nr:copper resistance protein CopC [Rhodospirillaceae bacterium]